MKTVHFNTN